MNRELAAQIAVEQARENAPSYYSEPFTPHEWVIDSMMRAYHRGVVDGAHSAFDMIEQEETNATNTD